MAELSGIGQRILSFVVPKPPQTPASTDTASARKDPSRAGHKTGASTAMAAQSQDTFTLKKAKTLDVPPAPLNPSGRAFAASSGAEAAARLKNETNYPTADWKDIRAWDFLGTVEAHKNDPAFMQQLYEAQGPEATSQLLGDVTRVVQQQGEAEARRGLTSVARSFDAMPPSFRTEVGREAARNCPHAAMLLKHGTSLEAKQGFLEGIKSAAVGQSDTAFNAAREAGEVIASDPRLVQHVAKTWSASETSALLTNGLRSPPLPDNLFNSWPDYHPDGLERMVGMMGSLPKEQYKDLHARVFRDASLVLDTSTVGDPNRQSLVSNLETLFKSDGRGIVDGLFNNSKRPDKPYDSTHQALGLFFRDALFAHPGKDAPFNQYVSGFLGRLQEDMLDPKRIDQDPRTPSNDLLAKHLGDTVGSLALGYALAVKDNGDKTAARTALVDSLVGLVSQVVPPGGPLRAQARNAARNVVSQALGDAFTQDLKTDKKTMTQMTQALFDLAFAGARDFDESNAEKPIKTSVEDNFKTEVQWVEFVGDLFER